MVREMVPDLFSVYKSGTFSLHDSEHDLCGYETCDGEVALQAKFYFAYEFTDGGIAAVMDETGWYYISKSGEFVIRPKIYDNGPDYFSDGLSRYVDDGKYGYFDQSGTIVVNVKHEFAWPFENGRRKLARIASSSRTASIHLSNATFVTTSTNPEIDVSLWPNFVGRICHD